MADEKRPVAPLAPPRSCSRRQLVRGAALAACAPALGSLVGCGKRVSPERDVTVGNPVDGRLVVPKGQIQELDRAGGAAVLHTSCLNPILVANTGAGIVALGAVCPHATCELAWVPEDRQAECPCHGSRFAGDGTLLAGPATSAVPAYPATIDASGAIVISVFAGDKVFPAVVDNSVTFDLALYPRLQTPGGAVVGHPDGSPIPIVVTRPTNPSTPIPPEAGGLMAMSASCTHLACTVLPISSTSLRCPCHGSAFDLDGTVRNPPALDNLPLLSVTFDSATGTVTIQLPATC